MILLLFLDQDASSPLKDLKDIRLTPLGPWNSCHGFPWNNPKSPLAAAYYQPMTEAADHHLPILDNTFIGSTLTSGGVSGTPFTSPVVSFPSVTPFTSTSDLPYITPYTEPWSSSCYLDPLYSKPAYFPPAADHTPPNSSPHGGESSSSPETMTSSSPDALPVYSPHGGESSSSPEVMTSSSPDALPVYSYSNEELGVYTQELHTPPNDSPQSSVLSSSPEQWNSTYLPELQET